MGSFVHPELAMQPLPSRSILDHFSALSDPRQQWRVIYPLREILLLVLCATLCGMDDFVETKLWGEQRLSFLGAVRNSVRAAMMMERSESSHGYRERIA
jgi:hypothetical protein